MIDIAAAQLSLRARALTLSVATTGSTSLSATATGYARAAGSFVTDSFRAGMEVLASGFDEAANDGSAMITSVTALALGIAGGRTVESAEAGKTLTVGLPALRAWEELPLTRDVGRPYIEEAMIPATAELITFPADQGNVEETGLYVLRWYGPSGQGHFAIREAIDALKALYAPGTALSLAGDDVIRVRADVGPFAGQIRPLDGGWSVCTLTVPWLARSVNVVV